jgi:hypothetical protein
MTKRDDNRPVVEEAAEALLGGNRTVRRLALGLSRDTLQVVGDR